MADSPTGSDTPDPDLWLVVEEGARAGTSLRLEDRPVLIGRDPEAALRMDPTSDRLVSARHALVAPTEEGWVLEDLDSRNGTFLNGHRLEKRRALRRGDRIQLGSSGPILLFTDRPIEAVVRRPQKTAASVGSPAAGPARTPLVIGGLAVAGLALALWATAPGSDAGPSPGQDAPPGLSTTEGTEAAVGPALDSTAARQAREIAALREEVETLREGIRRSEAESERLRSALAEAERTGASGDSIRVLERRLQSANAAVRRQQLAASLDFEAIGSAVRPATVQIYVEFEGERVVVATAFGIDDEGGLLTNKHVVRDEAGRTLRRIGIRYPGHEGVVPARIVAVSPNVDLALLELTTPRASYPRIAGFNDSVDTLDEGSPLGISGFPLGGGDPTDGSGPQPLLSSGVLMGWDGDYLEIEGYGRSGASGSPIVDADGRVIGILIGGRTGEGGERLFALPASRIISFLRSVSAPG